MAFPQLSPGPALPRRALVAIALAVPGAAPRFAAADARTPVFVGGTGTAIGLLQALAELQAARDVPPWRVLPSLGSEGGLRALAAGRLDIAFSLHEASPGDPTLQRQVLARTPVALVTRGGGPARHLSADQAVRLLGGEDAAWPDGSPARPVLRPPREREWLALPPAAAAIARMAEGPQRRAGQVVAATAQENIAALAAIPGSIGVVTLGQLLVERADLQVVALDGLVPGVDALRAGRWPHAVTVHAAARAPVQGAAAAVLAFLAAPEAGAAMEALGYLPAARPA
jgi:phosphate transport system substrate-binding protein